MGPLGGPLVPLAVELALKPAPGYTSQMSTWLSAGGHAPGSDEFCTMERVAALAGEDHTDHPAAANDWLAAQCRSANDTLDDAARQLLALLLEPLAKSAALTVAVADAVRVQAALAALHEAPSAATAAVFVWAVRMAIDDASNTGRGGVEGALDPRAARDAAHAAVHAARVAQEQERQAAAARAAEVARVKRAQRSAAAAAAREAEAQRIVAAERARERAIAEARNVPLSSGTVQAVHGLLSALSGRALGQPAMHYLEERVTVEVIPKEHAYAVPKERAHAIRR